MKGLWHARAARHFVICIDRPGDLGVVHLITTVYLGQG